MLQSKPEMRHWVKELRFEYSSPRKMGQSSKHTGWVGRRGLRALTKLVEILPGVNTLSFRFITLYKADHELSFIALAALKHVRHMSFYRCRGHFTAFVRLVKASPSLATVSIVESGFATMGEIQELNNVTLPRLSALSIVGCTYQQDEIRSWFRSAVKNEQWRSITVDVLHQYSMEETNRLLQDAGPHLRSLSIKFPDRGPDVRVPMYQFNTWGDVAHSSHTGAPSPDPATRDVALDNIDLGCNPNVRDLTLHNLDISEILPLLDRFVTLEIRTLSIRLSAVAVADTNVKAYRELDNHLGLGFQTRWCLIFSLSRTRQSTAFGGFLWECKDYSTYKDTNKNVNTDLNQNYRFEVYSIQLRDLCMEEKNHKSKTTLDINKIVFRSKTNVTGINIETSCDLHQILFFCDWVPGNQNL
ncbi:hypothetical protein NLI96_g7825 [Meripilus lineatus]|uniref:Uncharacterized protein n=1 Tax=Meripilus lineatus TaxID=2056292 RepID=A0AAD5UYF8_9APHY|nr:hypothetical protein NLI96_g7825 [Physisporinus lineatus]